METKDIKIEDLNYVEDDLTKDELISILFILYAKSDPKLLIHEFENLKKKNHLQEFAKHHEKKWKTLIIEAFMITGLFEIVDNLGISNSEAREHLSRSLETDSVVKNLYELCEACSEDLTKKLIEYIKTHCHSAKKSFSNLLEVHLTHMLASQQIKLSNFNFLKKFLNNQNDETIVEILKKLPCQPDTNFAEDSLFNDPNTYKTSKMKVLIINQEKFYREKNPELQALLPGHALKERRGTCQDMDALREMFSNFGYDVYVKNNLKHNEILIEIEKVSAISSEGLIVCLLSHGQEGIIYGHNSIPVKIKNIKSIMSSKNLLGKAKILIVQACQGDRLQVSAKNAIESFEYDSPTMSASSSSNSLSGSLFADFLTFWSTIEGFASVRHIEKGSWFIQELVTMIKSLHKTHHLVDVCTSVTNQVSSKRGYRDECMLPKLETTFTKNFYFPKREFS